jgi:hypothetical protein
MPRIPIFRIGHSSDEVVPPRLTGYCPRLSLEGLAAGVDNLRHDVYLSPKFVEQIRQQIVRLIARHGNVDEVLTAETPAPATKKLFAANMRAATPPGVKFEAAELKPLLADIHIAALNRAKAENNLSIDLLGRLAIIKFLRAELVTQFSLVLERCRMKLKSFEGVRQDTALEMREKVAGFQVAKKPVLRKVSQELFQTLQELEKETLARMRRSLFGETAGQSNYRLFINRLMFTDDGRDDYINAEHYVMLGNWDRDPDRFPQLRQIACNFLQSLELGEAEQLDTLDSWMNAPENAQELVAGGTPDVSTPEGRSQEARLSYWMKLLEESKVMDYVIASYEVIPLLPEYSPRINAQQLKNALISRSECSRVEGLIKEHGRLSTDSLYAGVDRVSVCRGAERAKVAGRFLRDFFRYHRDLRQLEALNSALDSVNLIGSEKLRELSSLNGTLYEFLLADEQKPAEERVIQHVIIKADIRDSTRLTRSLMERGLNPASYFSLNFFEPVYKLLPKYEALKVFLEGDAMILALLEREGAPRFAVSRACALAREILDIVRGYNHLLQRSGLPALELGLGVCLQESAPLYLLDGDQRIMISDALNESDRLSSCSKRARKAVEPLESNFNVYAFQTVSDDDAGENVEDFVMNYNLNGIRMNESAFRKLSTEISLEQQVLEVPALWGTEQFKIYSGVVPLGNGVFRKIAIRESRVPQIDPRTSAFRRWTPRSYYEVCSNPAVYAMLEEKTPAAN